MSIKSGSCHGGVHKDESFFFLPLYIKCTEFLYGSANISCNFLQFRYIDHEWDIRERSYDLSLGRVHTGDDQWEREGLHTCMEMWGDDQT